MRPLTEDELRKLYEKLHKYIGKNLRRLVERQDGQYCFRLHKDRVYYLPEHILRLSTNVGNDELMSAGGFGGRGAHAGAADATAAAATAFIAACSFFKALLLTSSLSMSLFQTGTCFGKFSKKG